MRVVRLVGLLALALWFGPGPPGSVAPSMAGARADLLAIGSPVQSLPTPAHDETSCAFCQAALFSPCVGHAPAVLPELAARICRLGLTPDERILHVVSNRPVSSRGPPMLSLA
jgi:hypothetical protein